MKSQRPDPDTLLERVTAEQHTRGRLKIYLGMAAGVGKTYAMLSDALTEKRRGIDVVSGYIEPHGRIETEQLGKNFEQINLRQIEHKGINLREFDLDEALKRKPEILILDELAHSNAPNSRHSKRWQDIEECLAHGINVYTTLNVQHIESLSDVVTKITGIPITETIPDVVVKKADEIELIDITPGELIQRLKEGKVYVKDKVDTALGNFFKHGNLLALRELVLRLTAERVDEQLTTFRRQHEVREIWPAKPRVLVCVSPNILAERVVRSAWRLASSMHTELVAVSIDVASGATSSDENIEHAEDGLELARSLGAQVIRRSSSDVVAEILAIAREQNANIIVMGKPVRSRIREYLFGSIVDELIRRSGDLDVYVITDRSKESSVPLRLHVGPPTSRGVLTAILITGVTTGICMIAEQFLALSNLVMFYLLAVAWASSKLGRVESVITAVLSVMAFDFFFVPPTLTFVVADFQYVVTFIVMLAIGLLISTLTLRLKNQAELVAKRERRTASLYDVSKRLAAAASVTQIGSIVKEKSIELFGCEGLLFVPNSEGRLSALTQTTSKFEQSPHEIAVASWVAEHKARAGAGTDTLAGANATYIPLATHGETACVLALARSEWDRGNDILLEAFASQISSALDRIFAEQDSTAVEVEVEREKVRNILLSSVSHDFRTPLSAISGAADTLAERYAPSSEQGRELLQSIRTQADGLARLVRNVLDLTRVESGELRLNLEWESLEELIGSALERTSALLQPREVCVHLGSELPLVKVDATLMVQVFVNLFENIAKHTPSNTKVFITAAVKKSSDASEKTILISVHDTGPGLPSGTESKVFEKSFRANAEGQGFGLGLTICQAILSAHKGSIVASNASDGGAVFVIAIPLPTEQPELEHGQ